MITISKDRILSTAMTDRADDMVHLAISDCIRDENFPVYLTKYLTRQFDPEDFFFETSTTDYGNFIKVGIKVLVDYDNDSVSTAHVLKGYWVYDVRITAMPTNITLSDIQW